MSVPGLKLHSGAVPGHLEIAHTVLSARISHCSLPVGRATFRAVQLLVVQRSFATQLNAKRRDPNHPADGVPAPAGYRLQREVPAPQVMSHALSIDERPRGIGIDRSVRMPQV